MRGVIDLKLRKERESRRGQVVRQEKSKQRKSAYVQRYSKGRPNRTEQRRHKSTGWGVQKPVERVPSRLRVFWGE